MDKPSVPKFGSFKPKPSSAISKSQKEPGVEDLDRSHQRAYKDGVDRHDRKSELHKDGGSSRDRRQYRKHEHRPRYNDRHHLRTPTPENAQRTDFTEPDDLFVIDHRGDRKNVEYGGLHRYSIPSYHRIGSGRILGADRRARIDRDASQDKAIVFRFDRGERAQRLLTRKNLRLEGRSQRVVLPHAGDGLPQDAEQDFVPFGQTSKRRRLSKSPDQVVHEVDYRSVEGKAKPETQPDDSDLEFDSDSDGGHKGDSSNTHVRSRNAELSRIAKAEPASADAWLALVEHQAKAVFPDVESDNLLPSQLRSIADIRLSIFDQAFKVIQSGAAGYDRLVAGYINEGSQIWETSKMEQKWKAALKQAPSSLLLWRGYLGFVQTAPRMFQYETCREAYMQCLKALHGCYASTQQPAEQRSIIRSIAYVLLGLTRFTADAGYDELAIAIWQATIEYHVLAPGGPDFSERKAKMKAFEEFWESDSARIGEESAMSWQFGVSHSGHATRQTSKHHPSIPDTPKPLVNFAQAEEQMAKAFFLPAVTDDEKDEDDPFRYVMFSDIQPVLDCLPDQLRSEKWLLLDAFLCFMQLPPVQQDCNVGRDWQSDPFVQTIKKNAEGGTRKWDTFELFRTSWIELSSETAHFVRLALSLLITHLPDYEELGEYLLAFLCHTKSDETTKTAKRLLKSRPTSLRYYNAYALATVACSKGNSEPNKAEVIWTKALALAGNLGNDEKEDCILLWHSWLVTLLHAGSQDKAFRLLLKVLDGSAATVQKSTTNVSPGAILRARRHFDEGIDRLRLKDRSHLAVLHADCLAWLLYLSPTSTTTSSLSHSYDIDAALQTFGAISSTFAKTDARAALELTHQAQARLIAYHVKARRAFQPARFRSLLQQSQSLFPENTLILRNYYELGKFTRLDDRLRNAVHGISPPSGLWGWLSAIEAEIERSVDGGPATRESVRSLFRRALLHPTKHSVLLWKRWLDFESTVDGPSGRAKQVFFEGLRFLPWSKAWAVEGMAVLGGKDGMTAEDWRGCYDVMIERELRIRVHVADI